MGADNQFASLWQKADTGQIKGAAAFQAPTARNPMIDADFLAAEEAALGPDDFRREFGAEFIAGGGAFFDSEEIRAVSQGWKELLPGMPSLGRWRSTRPAGSVTRSRSRSLAVIPGAPRTSSAVSFAAGFPSASAGSRAPSRNAGSRR